MRLGNGAKILVKFETCGLRFAVLIEVLLIKKHIYVCVFTSRLEYHITTANIDTT